MLIISDTSTLEESLNTTSPRTNIMLITFIQMFGCVDIILLFAYVAVSIYDRKGLDKEPGHKFPTYRAPYENIEVVSFFRSSSGMN